jgi:hypothetical protein
MPRCNGALYERLTCSLHGAIVLVWGWEAMEAGGAAPTSMASDGIGLGLGHFKQRTGILLTNIILSGGDAALTLKPEPRFYGRGVPVE